MDTLKPILKTVALAALAAAVQALIQALAPHLPTPVSTALVAGAGVALKSPFRK